MHAQGCLWLAFRPVESIEACGLEKIVRAAVIGKNTSVSFDLNMGYIGQPGKVENSEDINQ